MGGFGESQYLQEQIKHTLDLWDVNIRIPDTSWTSVVRGAVICGIEKATAINLAKATSCLHSYGIAVNQPFSATDHDLKDLVEHTTNGIQYAQGHLIWLLVKGDLILSDRPKVGEETITVSFSTPDNRSGKVTIYRYSDDDRPKRLRTAKHGKSK